MQVKRQAQEAAPRQQSGSIFRSLLGLDEDKVLQFSGSAVQMDTMQPQSCFNTASCVHSMSLSCILHHAPDCKLWHVSLTIVSNAEPSQEDTAEAEAPKPRFGFGGTRKVATSQPASKPDKRAARAARSAPKQVRCPTKPGHHFTACVPRRGAGQDFDVQLCSQGRHAQRTQRCHLEAART
jgi:hypothetical protein